MALAVCFLVVLTGLEAVSIRFLNQLKRRENGLLLVQETFNSLRAQIEEGKTPANVTNNAVTRDGINYIVEYHIEPAPGAPDMNVTNSTVALADLENRASLLTVTVHWNDEFPHELNRSSLMARRGYPQP